MKIQNIEICLKCHRIQCLPAEDRGTIVGWVDTCRHVDLEWKGKALYIHKNDKISQEK